MRFNSGRPKPDSSKLFANATNLLETSVRVPLRGDVQEGDRSSVAADGSVVDDFVGEIDDSIAQRQDQEAVSFLAG